jgi:serine/threonine-protein kinase
MAPEQVAGEAIDGRADLYALGCVLYEMLTGQRPFEGPSSVVVLGKQLREDPMPMRAVAPDAEIPEALERIVMRALCKQPSERFASAEEMRAAMQSLLAPRARFVKKLPRALAYAGLASLLALGLGATLAHPPSAPRVELDTADSAPAPLSPPAPADIAVAAPVASIASEPPAIAASALPVAKETSKLDVARAAARTHPNDPRKLKAWAHAARSAGDLREARRAADAWALHDGTAEPKVFLAQVLDQMGKRIEARAVLEEVLDKYPDASDARRLHAKLGATLPDPHKTAQR